MIEKSARDADFYAYLHHFCCKSARVCIKCTSSLHFQNGGVSPDKPPVLMQTTCRIRADFADLVQTLCRLSAHFFLTFFKKSASCRLCRLAKVCMSAKIWHADFMHTFSMRCKVCIKSPTRSSKPDRNSAIKHNATTHSAYLLRSGRAPAPQPPPPPCWP